MKFGPKKGVIIKYCYKYSDSDEQLGIVLRQALKTKSYLNDFNVLIFNLKLFKIEDVPYYRIYDRLKNK